MQCGGDGRVDEVLTPVQCGGDGRVDEVLTLCNVEVTGGWMRYSPCAMWR